MTAIGPSNYLLDTDAVLNLIGGRNPTAPVRRLTKLANDHRLRVPAAVIRELRERDDRARRWVDSHEATLAVPEDGRVLQYHALVLDRYNRFLTTRVGAADPLVICRAMYLNSEELGWVVVSNDHGIEVACHREGFQHLRWKAFRMHEGF